MSIDDARQKVEVRRRHYNDDRPHSALGSLALRLIQLREQSHFVEDSHSNWLKILGRAHCIRENMYEI